MPPTNGSHEWSQFELRILYSLMIRGLHNAPFDPSKSSSREEYLDIATELNKALNNGDVTKDLPLKEVSKMVKHILNKNKGAVAFLERHKSGHLTRKMLSRFERTLNFTGSMKEWNDGRKEVEAAKEKPFFDVNQADFDYKIERDIWGVVTRKTPVRIDYVLGDIVTIDTSQIPAASGLGGAAPVVGATDAWVQQVANNAGPSATDSWGAEDSNGAANTSVAGAWGAAGATSSAESTTTAISTWEGGNASSENNTQNTGAYGVVVSAMNSVAAFGQSVIETTKRFGVANDSTTADTQPVNAWGGASGTNASSIVTAGTESHGTSASTGAWVQAADAGSGDRQTTMTGGKTKDDCGGGGGTWDKVGTGGAEAIANKKSDTWGGSGTWHDTSVGGTAPGTSGWSGTSGSNGSLGGGWDRSENVQMTMDEQVAAERAKGNKVWDAKAVNDFLSSSTKTVWESDKRSGVTSTGDTAMGNAAPAVPVFDPQTADWSGGRQGRQAKPSFMANNTDIALQMPEPRQFDPLPNVVSGSVPSWSMANNSGSAPQELPQPDTFPSATQAASSRPGFMSNQSADVSYDGVNPERLQRLARDSQSPEPEPPTRSSYDEVDYTSVVPRPTFKGANADPLPFNRFERRNTASTPRPVPAILRSAPIHDVERPWLTDNNKENEDPDTQPQPNPATGTEWGGGAVSGSGGDAVDTEMGEANDGWATGSW